MSADKIFRYGELEAKFDVSDFAAMERAETAFAELSALPAAIAKIDGNVQKLKTTFYAYTGALETILGDEDAANKALGKSTSLDEATDALFALIDFIRAQDKAIAARWETLARKYSPVARRGKK